MDSAGGLEATLPAEVLGDLERAAELQGRSLNDFVASAAHAEARRTIQEVEIIHLSGDDALTVAEAILNPPEPNAAMRRAIERHRRLILRSDP